MKDFNDFVRACYLNSEPSVDILTCEEQIDCCKHRLAGQKYVELQNELIEALKEQATAEDVRLATNMWCLQSGPQLYEWTEQ